MLEAGNVMDYVENVDGYQCHLSCILTNTAF